MNKFYIRDNDELTMYEKEHNRVSYKRVIDRCLDSMIMCNSYLNVRYDHIEPYNGTDYNEEEDYYYNIFQIFIIDGYIDMLIKYLPDAIIYYDKELDLYLLGVTHFGTSWDYVLTNLEPTQNINEN